MTMPSRLAQDDGVEMIGRSRWAEPESAPPTVTDARAGLAQAEQEMDAAREARAVARCAAAEASLRERDLRYLMQQGVMPTDDPEVKITAEAAGKAKDDLIRADVRLAAARRALDLARATLRQAEAADLAVRRAAWVEAHHADVAAEVRDAERELADAVNPANRQHLTTEA